MRFAPAANEKPTATGEKMLSVAIGIGRVVTRIWAWWIYTTSKKRSPLAAMSRNSCGGR